MSAIKKPPQRIYVVRDIGFLFILLILSLFASAGDESVRAANPMLTPSRAPLLKPCDPN